MTDKRQIKYLRVIHHGKFYAIWNMQSYKILNSFPTLEELAIWLNLQGLDFDHKDFHEDDQRMIYEKIYEV